MIIIMAIKMPYARRNIHVGAHCICMCAESSLIVRDTNAARRKREAGLQLCCFTELLLWAQNLAHEYANSNVKNAPESWSGCFGGRTVFDNVLLLQNF